MINNLELFFISYITWNYIIKYQVIALPWFLKRFMFYPKRCKGYLLVPIAKKAQVTILFLQRPSSKQTLNLIFPVN